MLYRDLKKAGVFNLMPNGFNLYICDVNQRLWPVFDNNEWFYVTDDNSKRISSKQLEKAEVKYIGSDPDGEFVPALWIVL